MPTTPRRSTSIAADPAAARTGREAGVSFVETMIVLTVFSMLILTFFKSLIMVRSGNEMVAQHNDVNTRCQRALNRLVNQASASARLYGDGPVGTALLNILQGVPETMLADSKLPVIAPTGIVEKDQVGQRATGNILLFLQAGKPFTYRPLLSPADTNRIDVYHVVAVYLRRKLDITGPLKDRVDGLDLVMFRSVPMLDLNQVQDVTDIAERAALLIEARNGRKIDYVFDTTAPIASALQTFDALGAIETILPANYEIPQLTMRQFFEHRSLSVATNGAPERFGVARFSQVDSSGEGFPHGFEVRLLGKAGARQLFLHLVVANESKPSGKYVFTELNATAVSRDF